MRTHNVGGSDVFFNVFLPSSYYDILTPAYLVCLDTWNFSENCGWKNILGIPSLSSGMHTVEGAAEMNQMRDTNWNTPLGNWGVLRNLFTTPLNEKPKDMNQKCETRIMLSMFSPKFPLILRNFLTPAHFFCDLCLVESSAIVVEIFFGRSNFQKS